MVVLNTNRNQIFFTDFNACELYLNALGEPRERNNTNRIFNHPANEFFNHDYYDRKDDLISLGITLLELNAVHIPSVEEMSDYDEYGIEVNKNNMNDSTKR